MADHWVAFLARLLITVFFAMVGNAPPAAPERVTASSRSKLASDVVGDAWWISTATMFVPARSSAGSIGSSLKDWPSSAALSPGVVAVTVPARMDMRAASWPLI